MSGNVGFHNGRGVTVLRHIGEQCGNFLRSLVEIGSKIIAHNTGNWHTAIDADNIIACGIISEVINECRRFSLVFTGFGYGPEHGGLQIVLVMRTVGLNNGSTQRQFAVRSIGVFTDLIAPGVFDPGIFGKNGECGLTCFFTGPQAISIGVRIENSLPDVHKILGIIKTKGGSFIIIKLLAIRTQSKTEHLEVSRNIRVTAGLFIDFFISSLQVVNRRRIGDLNTRCIRNILTVDRTKGIDARGNPAKHAVDQTA